MHLAEMEEIYLFDLMKKVSTMTLPTRSKLNKKEIIPQEGSTEAIGLPTGWKKVRLGEVFTFIGGGTPSKANKDFWNGNLNWASVKDIKETFLVKTEDRITENGLKESSSRVAEENDLILVTRISPGKVTIVKSRTAINQDLKIAKPTKEVNPLFAYYYFNQNEREFIKRSNGTTVKGISLNVINDLIFPLPSLTEQHLIVSKLEELFSELDKGIEQLKTAQQLLKVYRQAVLKHAFEGRLTYKDVKEGELPERWKWVNLNEMVNKIFDGPFGSHLKSNDYVENGIRVIRLENIASLRFIEEHKTYVTQEKYESIMKHTVLNGDIVFSSFIADEVRVAIIQKISRKQLTKLIVFA